MVPGGIVLYSYQCTYLGGFDLDIFSLFEVSVGGFLTFLVIFGLGGGRIGGGIKLVFASVIFFFGRPTGRFSLVDELEERDFFMSLSDIFNFSTFFGPFLSDFFDFSTLSEDFDDFSGFLSDFLSDFSAFFSILVYPSVLDFGFFSGFCPVILSDFSLDNFLASLTFDFSISLFFVTFFGLAFLVNFLTFGDFLFFGRSESESLPLENGTDRFELIAAL